MPSNNGPTDSHKKRFHGLGKLVLPDFESLAWEQYAERLRRQREVDPQLKHAIIKNAKEGRAIAGATIKNGAALPADQQLRQFYMEYTGRVWQAGLRSLPGSFNVMEAFLEFDAPRVIFRLKSEKDFLISVEDFLDFVTSDKSPDDYISAAYTLENGIIYNYSAYDDPRVCMFATEDGSEYGLSALSFIRRDDELSIMLIAGEAYDPEDIQRATFNIDESTSCRTGAVETLLNESLKEQGTTWKALPLDDKSPVLWRNVLLCRLDLRKQAMVVRYLLREFDFGYRISTDDPNTFQGDSQNLSAQDTTRLQAGTEECDNKHTLFDIAKTAVFLPSYVRFKYTVIRQSNRQTDLAKQLASSLKTKRQMDDLPTTEKILVRKISAIRVVNVGRQIIVGRHYTPPHFQVEVEGFWRHFADPDWIGHGEEGEPVKGKTWVKAHQRYKDKPRITDSTKIVYIKSRLPKGRPEQLSVAQESASTVTDLPLNDTSKDNHANVEETGTCHFIYTLVNPAHMADLYKVGWTSRSPEDRARELSAATGTPTRYLVIQFWRVNNGPEAEKKVHMALDRFRLAGNREFFQLPYHRLRDMLEDAISDCLLQ